MEPILEHLMVLIVLENWFKCKKEYFLNIFKIKCFILQYQLLTLYGVSCHYCILMTIPIGQPCYLKLSNLFKPTLGDWVGVGISKGNLPRGKLGSALRGITKHHQAVNRNKTYLGDGSLSAPDPAGSSSSVILLLVGSYRRKFRSFVGVTSSDFKAASCLAAISGS